MGGVDYRESHKIAGKGADYDARFRLNPHRAMVWSIERRILSRVAAELRSAPPVRCLDFACGTGRVLRHLECEVDEAVGIDISAEMLAVARDTVRRAELMEGDLTREDLLRGREFDLVTAFRFFPNAEAALRREVMAALTPRLSSRGLLVFNNHLNAGSLLRRASGLAGSGHESHSMARTEVQNMVSEAGLRIRRAYGIAYLPVSERRLQWAVRLIVPLERALASLNVAAMRPLAQDIVYVCERTV